MLENSSIGIQAGGTEVEFRAVAVTDPAAVAPIIARFRDKYGDGGVALYAKLDVAVVGELR